METKKLLEIIEALSSKYVDFWVDVCNLESPTADKQRVDACGKYFIDKAREKGWSVEINEQENAGNPICITLNPDSKNAPVILSGHIDTVHPVGLFGNPPTKVDGGRIYGPGVTDCKGGIVAGFMAMDALEQVGFKDRPVRLIIQTDEESGSRHSGKKTVGYMCERSKGAVAFLNLEPMGLNKDGLGKATVTRKGIERLSFKVRGKEAHASLCANEGANAIAEAAHKIVELNKLKDAKGITCNIGTIKGGSVSNTVAGYCEFEVDIRYATAQQNQWIKEYVSRIASQNVIDGCSCTVEEVSSRIAMEYSPKNIELLGKINDILGTYGPFTFTESAGMGGSDAAYVTAEGIPCLDSFGTIGGLLHSVGEFGEIWSLTASAKIQALVCALIRD